MQQVIGIDLGGTAIKLGRFDRQGNCLQSLTVSTRQPAYPDDILVDMVEAIAQIDPDQEAIAIGVGMPGPTDAAGRIARLAINLEGWREVPLAAWLEQRTGRPTTLANDANCAGLGEAWLGAGRSFDHLVLLTLGTGVGGAIISQGELFVGPKGTGGELGLITLNPDGPPCNSGNRGSLEQYVSVQAIRRRTGLDPADLAARAQAGDAEAIAFWRQYGRELGAGLASLIYVLTPDAIIIGGGVSASADLFFPSAWDEIEKRVLPISREGLQLLPAELGSQAGIVGAARLAWQWLDKAHSASSSPVPATSPPASPPAASPETLLRLAYHRAAEMSRFKAGFLARTSHELRSPINSVISLHQLLLAELYDSPEELREFIQQANASAKKMLSLLDEMTHVSKADYGSIQPDLQPLCMADVLEELHQFTRLQAQNRNLQLAIEPPDPDAYVLADPRWLRQVLLHLIDAPLAAMSEGGVKLSVQVCRDSQQVQIQIADQRPPESWSEPIEFLRHPGNSALAEDALPDAAQVKSTVAAIAQSLAVNKPLGLSLFLCQTLLELMQGRIDLVAVPAALRATLDPAIALDTTEDTICIRCTLPLVSESAG